MHTSLLFRLSPFRGFLFMRSGLKYGSSEEGQKEPQACENQFILVTCVHTSRTPSHYLLLWAPLCTMGVYALCHILPTPAASLKLVSHQVPKSFFFSCLWVNKSWIVSIKIEKKSTINHNFILMHTLKNHNFEVKLFLHCLIFFCSSSLIQNAWHDSSSSASV